MNGPYISWNEDNYKVLDGEYKQCEKIINGHIGMAMEFSKNKNLSSMVKKTGNGFGGVPMV